METIIVNKRFGEWVDVRDFVRPNDPMVADVVDARSDWTVESLWDWVLQHIRYPAGSFLTLDYHSMVAFHRNIPLIGWLLGARRYATIDFWEYPGEVLRDGMADCEGSSVLLASMIQRALPSPGVWVSVGYFFPDRYVGGPGFGHVWVSLLENGRWRVLDTTLLARPNLPVYEEPEGPYRAIFRFSSESVLIEDEKLQAPERTHEPGKDRALRSWYALIPEGLRSGPFS